MINIIRKGNKTISIVRFTCPDCGEDVYKQVTDTNETDESKKSC